MNKNNGARYIIIQSKLNFSKTKKLKLFALNFTSPRLCSTKHSIIEKSATPTHIPSFSKI